MGTADDEAVLVAVELPVIVTLTALVVESSAEPLSRLKLVDVLERLEVEGEEPLATANVVSRRAVLPLTLVVVEYEI